MPALDLRCPSNAARSHRVARRSEDFIKDSPVVTYVILCCVLAGISLFCVIILIRKRLRAGHSVPLVCRCLHRRHKVTNVYATGLGLSSSWAAPVTSSETEVKLDAAQDKASTTSLPTLQYGHSYAPNQPAPLPSTLAPCAQPIFPTQAPHKAAAPKGFAASRTSSLKAAHTHLRHLEMDWEAAKAARTAGRAYVQPGSGAGRDMRSPTCCTPDDPSGTFGRKLPRAEAGCNDIEQPSPMKGGVATEVGEWKEEESNKPSAPAHSPASPSSLRKSFLPAKEGKAPGSPLRKKVPALESPGQGSDAARQEGGAVAMVKVVANGYGGLGGGIDFSAHRPYSVIVTPSVVERTAA